MKWLISADVHVYQHKKSAARLQDCLDALDWIFSTAVSQSVDHVIIAGDLFYDRFKIDVPTYQKTFEIFKKYTDANDFGVWLLVGNHDMFLHQRWDISSMIPFSGMPTVTVVNKPCKMQVGDRWVGFLPYTDDPITHLRDIEAQSPEADVLFGHVALDNAVLNPFYNTRSEVQLENDGDMIKVEADVFKNWKQVFLGHYHAQQTIGGNVEYVGSPLQLSFGEAFQEKHVIIYHPDADIKQYIENDFSPKHYVIKRGEELDKYDVRGHFVKLLVDDLAKVDLLETRKEFLETHGAKTFEAKNNKNGGTIVEDEIIIENALTLLDNEYEIFERYVEECDKQEQLKGLDKDTLLKHCKTVIAKAREKEEGKDKKDEELEL